MRNDTRLSTTRAGQNQDRAFGRFDSFTLLGIEAREKVHFRTIFALLSGKHRQSNRSISETR